MTGADIFLAAKALGTTVAEVISKNFNGYIGKDSHLPLFELGVRMDGSCRFLRQGKCMIHQNKPAVCALYPLGRMFDTTDETYHYFWNGSNCSAVRGECRIWTLNEWLDEFHIRETEGMTKAWHKLMNSLMQRTYKMSEKSISGDLLNALCYELYIGYDINLPYIEQVESHMDAAQRLFGKR